METNFLIEYIKYRLAHLKDATFRRSCEEGDVDSGYVRRYLELRDCFESMWRRLTEEVSCRAFGNGPEAMALFDLIRLYVPRTCTTRRAQRDQCPLTLRRTDLSTLQFVTNPDKIWESFHLFEQLEKGGSVQSYLLKLEENDEKNQELSIASSTIRQVKLAWLTLNVDCFIDYNLERYAQCKPFDLADLASLLCRCYRAATTLTRIA